MKLLCGDIGGTKTRLALFDTLGDQVELVDEKSYRSSDYPSLIPVVEAFLQSIAVTVDAAGFGLAGPVEGRICKTTNLPWQVDADEMEQRLGIGRVELLNDLEATAWGIDRLDADDILTLQQGREGIPGNRAVIAAGTGLGEAGIFWDGSGYHPFATEGGHGDFSPTSDLECDLGRRLRARYGDASWERVLSGPGLTDIYRFLLQHYDQASPDWLVEAIRNGDPAAAISAAANAAQESLAGEAMELFTHLYGAEAGNLALKLMATGGIYIGGGIAPKIANWLQGAGFLNAFNDKGKMRSLMRSIPVRLILNDRAALYGPLSYLLH